jgi:hypothetical protein
VIEGVTHQLLLLLVDLIVLKVHDRAILADLINEEIRVAN